MYLILLAAFEVDMVHKADVVGDDAEDDEGDLHPPRRDDCAVDRFAVCEVAVVHVYRYDYEDNHLVQNRQSVVQFLLVGPFDDNVDEAAHFEGHNGVAYLAVLVEDSAEEVEQVSGHEQNGVVDLRPPVFLELVVVVLEALEGLDVEVQVDGQQDQREDGQQPAHDHEGVPDLPRRQVLELQAQAEAHVVDAEEEEGEDDVLEAEHAHLQRPFEVLVLADQVDDPEGQHQEDHGHVHVVEVLDQVRARVAQRLQPRVQGLAAARRLQQPP